MWFDLHRGWTVRAVGDTGALPDPVAVAVTAGIPAEVPGCVHTDLLAAGLIPDPYLDLNENELAWIGLTDWRYETVFDSPDAGRPAADGERRELVFDGLDTIAEIELNGTPLGSTRNMHRGYRFDVSGLLRETGNELSVTFASAVLHARARSAELGALPNVGNDEPANFIRKMACNFGWDWGPKLVTAGIWKRAGIEVWSGARLERVRPLVSVEGVDGASGGTRTGRVTVEVDLDRAGVDTARPLWLTARLAGTPAGTPAEAQVRIAPGERAATVELTVPDPELWWPHSLGAQPRYPLEVTLAEDGGTAPLDTWSRQIGFRTVTLDTSADVDGAGSAHTLSVNGVPIFVRGANWIPDDCFPTRVDAARYRRRITQSTEAGIDLLRIWGGGIYESEHFYDACDEAGVLVWQDFLFACAAYPEDAGSAAEVEAEARENVARLTPHPSLALWCGNNENYMGWQLWGWPEEVGERPWGSGYYQDLLPRVVAETDPTRPYVPASPWSNDPERSVLDDAHGSMHIWDVWNQVDYTVYRDYIPRFATEFGWQAPPTWSTLTRSVHDAPMAPDSAGVLHHQKAEDGNGKLERGLAHHFDPPADFSDWHFLTQVVQARAIRTGLEHFRSHRGVCMGSVVWQINDCWPVTSWAAVDGDERRKPLWYAMRSAYADQLLTVQPRGEGLAAVAVHDGTGDWSGTVLLRRVRFDGRELARAEAKFEITGRGTAEIAVPEEVAAVGDAKSELLLAELVGGGAGDAAVERAMWFFAEDKELAYPAPSYTATAARTADGAYRVRVTATTLLRELALFPDRLDAAAEADQCLVTLLPGETTTFTVRTTAELDVNALTATPVLQTVNAAALASR